MSPANSNKTFFIQQYLSEKYVHGGVGFVDAERILLQMGFTPLIFPSHTDFSLKGKLKRLSFLLKLYRSIPKSSTVIFISPIYAKMVRLLIKMLSSRKSVRLICMVADVEGIKSGNETLLRQELSLFKKLKLFITMNDAAAKWFKEKVPGSKTSSLNFFSFLTEPVTSYPERSLKICFAGNLVKSPFLEKIKTLQENNPQLKFLIYGPGVTDGMKNSDNMLYKGVYPAHELPGKLEGSFGLIWEGDAIDQTGSAIGFYTRYISNHKLSLYVLSGLPVIIWDEAGAAALVKRYNIGITVKNLTHLQTAINGISDETYRQMQKNMKPLAAKISQGLFQQEAINELLKQSPY